MHGLDPQTDFSFLKGRIVTKVLKLSNQIQLHCDADVRIYLECHWILSLLGEREQLGFAATETEYNPAIELLTDKKIDRSVPSSDGTLIIYFTDSSRLTLKDEPEYEAYQITAPGRFIVV